MSSSQTQVHPGCLQIFERESIREKNLEKAQKEAKIKARRAAEAAMKAELHAPEPAEVVGHPEEDGDLKKVGRC